MILNYKNQAVFAKSIAVVYTVNLTHYGLIRNNNICPLNTKLVIFENGQALGTIYPKVYIFVTHTQLFITCILSQLFTKLHIRIYIFFFEN